MTNIINKSSPTVSVLIPIYNGLPYLDAAIASVLGQTFQDFEIIIINDGSTDDSASVVEKFNDPRIRYFQQENMGLSATLNRAISMAKGQYIARQDQDDICFPLRLQKQVAFLDSNPDIGMVGASAEIWVDNNRTERLLAHPVDDVSLRMGLLFDNYFVHSSIMIRQSVLKKVGGYTEDLSRCPPEDYELWSRVVRTTKVANLPDVLMAYREVSNSMSRVSSNPFLHNLEKISAENIARASNCSLDSACVIALSKLMHGDYEGVPRGVGYSEVYSLLDKAMRETAKESGVSLQSMIRSSGGLVNRLRYHFVDYRFGGYISKALNGRFGGWIKSMVRSLYIKDTRQ